MSMKSWSQNSCFEQGVSRIEIFGHWRENGQKRQLFKTSQATTSPLDLPARSPAGPPNP